MVATSDLTVTGVVWKRGQLWFVVGGGDGVAAVLDVLWRLDVLHATGAGWPEDPDRHTASP